MPRPFWALFAATLVNRSASFVGPFLVLYLSQRGLDVQTVGLVSERVDGAYLHPVYSYDLRPISVGE